MLDDLTVEIKENIRDEKIQSLILKHWHHCLIIIILIVLFSGIYLWRQNIYTQKNMQATKIFMNSKDIIDIDKKIAMLSQIKDKNNKLGLMAKMELANSYSAADKQDIAEGLYREIFAEKHHDIWYELALINLYSYDKKMKNDLLELHNEKNYLYRFAPLAVAVNDLKNHDNSDDKIQEKILFEISKSPTEKLSQLSKQIIGVMHEE